MQPSVRSQLASKNPRLLAKIDKQDGFITSEDIPELIKFNRHLLVLVRCGQGRFVCPVDCVNHYVNVIGEYAKLKSKETGQPEYMFDYVRDVSFPA